MGDRIKEIFNMITNGTITQKKGEELFQHLQSQYLFVDMFHRLR